MRLYAMNGLGNRIAVLDGSGRPIALDTARVLALAADPRVPAFDQLMTLEPPRDGVDADLFTAIWNTDGSPAGACGNGARCVAWRAMEQAGADRVCMQTVSGLLEAERAGPMRVAVDMGPPGLDWTQIPLSERMDTIRMELQVGPIDDPVLWGPGAVSMGNPHVVFFVENIALAPVEKVGPMIEHHPLFPEGVNVGFAQVLAEDRIRLRVWERGAGLTQACGTGACAALVAAARRRLTGRRATLELDGGDLQIEWRADDRVIMTGPVALDAVVDLPDWA